MLESLSPYVGPTAGIATSLLWTGTSLLFTAAGRRLGPTLVNASRIALAIVLLGLTHRVLAGTWLPDVLARQVLLLALSGIVGLAIGDQALFTAFMDIGPRLSMLIMTTAPLFAALFGWLALDETLRGSAWLGIALVVAGVAWVILERPRLASGATSLPACFPVHYRARGVGLAFVAAACQAGGLLLSKQGMGHGWLPEGERLSPQAATFLRMLFAGLGVLPILALHAYRQRLRRPIYGPPLRVGSPRVGLLFAAGGAIVGPYFGVWMSLEAAHRAPVGVAQTLCSLPPIFILPFAALIHKEHISFRAVLGAFVAVGGVALLFFQSR
jgi:drug/metabolite transporter (DMT)-like permease